MNYSRIGGIEHRHLYEELVLEFCRRIVVGRWPAGKPLKAEAVIANEVGVSLGTVRRAFDRLSEMHLIDRAPGRGMVVCEFDNDRRFAALTNVVDLDGAPIRGDIAIGRISMVWADDDVAAGLDLSLGAQVVKVERTRSFRGRVFEIETAFSVPSSSQGLPEAEKALRDARALVVNEQIAVRRRERVGVFNEARTDHDPWFEEASSPILKASKVFFSVYNAPIEYSRSLVQLGNDMNYRIN